MKKSDFPKIKLKQLPFFKQGSLVFEESGHILRLSDRHYRCDLNCRGKCELPEKQIKIENLQRNFLTLLEKFEIKADAVDSILDRLMRENLADIILGPEKVLEQKDEIIDTTIIAAAQDWQKNGKVKRSDTKDIVQAYIEKKQGEYSILLAGMAFDVLRAINPNAQKRIGRGKTFARIIKALYLSNEGKILRIEFEPWGWYVLRLVNKNSPSYLDSVHKRGVVIVNKPDELENKNLAEAARYFVNTNPSEALGHNMGAASEWITLLSKSLKAVVKNDLGSVQQTQLILLKMMQNFPAVELLGTLAPALEQKPRLRK